MMEEKQNNEVLTAEDVKALQPLYADVILALKQVYDPEIPVNIYDLGLIYELNINKAREVSALLSDGGPGDHGGAAERGGGSWRDEMRHRTHVRSGLGPQHAVGRGAG